MTSSSASNQRQAEQLRRFMHWVKTEGGSEGPTRLSTLMLPRQQARMDWLKKNVVGTVLEVGTCWGYVLAWVGGQEGVDIVPGNVELARLLSPDRAFKVADAASLDYGSRSFDTVMVPETLEHLDWPHGVRAAYDEALRIARRRVLITLPDGREDTPDATNFKHAWLADQEVVDMIVGWAPEAWKCTLEEVEGFLCLSLERIA